MPQKKAHWKRNMKKLSLQPIAPESYAETSRWLWVQSWNNSLYLAWLIPKALFKSVSGSKTSCATKESTLEKEHEETVSATHSTRKLCWNFTVTLGAVVNLNNMANVIIIFIDLNDTRHVPLVISCDFDYIIVWGRIVLANTCIWINYHNSLN